MGKGIMHLAREGCQALWLDPQPLVTSTMPPQHKQKIRPRKNNLVRIMKCFGPCPQAPTGAIPMMQMTTLLGITLTC